MVRLIKNGWTELLPFFRPPNLKLALRFGRLENGNSSPEQNQAVALFYHREKLTIFIGIGSARHGKNAPPMPLQIPEFHKNRQPSDVAKPTYPDN
jgi:hypothetical protein